MVNVIEDKGLHYLMQEDGTRRVVRDEVYFKQNDLSVAESYRAMKAREIGSGRYTVLGETVDPHTGEVLEKVEIRFQNRPQGGGYLNNGQSIDGMLGVNRTDARTQSGDQSRFEDGKYITARKTAVAVVGYRKPFESTVKNGACLLDEMESARWILPEEVEQRVQGVTLGNLFAQSVENKVYVADTGAQFRELELD